MPAIDKLNEAIKEMAEENSSLFGYAAEAALQVLSQNWEAAAAAGESLPELIGDIDKVVELLKGFKAEAVLIAEREASTTPAP